MKPSLPAIALGAVAVLALVCGATWRLRAPARAVTATSVTTPAHERPESENPPRPAPPAGRLTNSIPSEVSTDETPAAVLEAAAEPDSARRIEATSAALRAWAAADPEAAGFWARDRAPIPRSIAMAAVFDGALVRGANFLEPFFRQICRHDPAQTAEYGGYLIHALGDIGEHQRAATWAETGSDQSAVDWMTAAYGRWAAAEPEAALLAATAVSEPRRRRAAVEAAIGAWARTRPQSLAGFAVTFPPGPEKNLALVSALRTWAENAPDDAANWIQTHREALTGLDRIEVLLEQ